MNFIHVKKIGVMKTKNKKPLLKKETVQQLTEIQLSKIQGGSDPPTIRIGNRPTTRQT
jgi:hypothetical protein